jgi:aryl-alcohol dehydrogenase (NADP+)
MEYVRLGKSGLKVSRLCLGTMSYGTPAWRPWVLGEDESRAIIRRALEAGINFFDTADYYSAGVSEEVVGRALRDFARREEVVIATKVFYPIKSHANAGGLSRKHIMEAVDDSLRRLGTDFIDLYQIHRYDPETPIAETLEALHDLVKAGKVRYLGASSMYAWQFARMVYTQRLRGWTEFISMQNHYNLVYRGSAGAPTRRCGSATTTTGARSITRTPTTTSPMPWLRWRSAKGCCRFRWPWPGSSRVQVSWRPLSA